jgi:hypothetical protein
MPRAISYLDFDLLIRRTERGYRAQVLASPEGEATADFTLPFSDLELENFVLRIGRPRRGTRRIDSSEMELAKNLGGRLYEAVFSGDLRACWRASVGEAEARDVGLRLRLRISDAPELNEIPWEYLYNAHLNQFVSLSVYTPLIRYLDLPERIRPLAVDGPLKILVMISSPTDPRYAGLDVMSEWSRLNEALAEPEQNGLVQLELLSEATLPALRRKLRGSEYHILHFIGHGGFDRETQEGVLVLCDEAGTGRLVAAQRLGMILRDHRSLRLVVLNACEGSRAARGDPFSGVAQTFVQQGVPAVIAMQFEITDQAAITFAKEFYAAVADGYPVDAALSEARIGIHSDDNDVEWGTPVLYLRAPDGRLFSVNRGATLRADAAQQAEEEKRRAEAARQAEEEKQRAEAARQAEEEKQRAEAARQAEEEKRRAEAARQAEEEKQRAEAARQAAEEKQRAEAARRAEEEKQRAEAVRQAEEEKQRPAEAALGNEEQKTTARRTLRPFTLLGHEHWVRSVAVLPDGQRALSGGWDRTMRLWDLETGEERRCFKTSDRCDAVAALPDGLRGLSGSGNTMQLWDLETGAELLRFENMGSVQALAVLPDGRRVISGSVEPGNETLRLWDLETGALLRLFRGNLGIVRAVTALPDGQRALSGSSDYILRLWHVETGAQLREFHGTPGGLWEQWLGHQFTSVAVLDDGRRALSPSGDRTMRLWDLETGAELRRSKVQPSLIRAVAVLPNGRKARFLALTMASCTCGT